MPYTSLLSEATRESLGLDINLDRTIVLFDEAHNIAETFASLNTVSLTLDEIADAVAALEKYLEHYKMRLSTSTAYYITQIGQILKNLKKFVLSRADLLLVKHDTASSSSDQNNLTEEIPVAKLLAEIKCLDYDLAKLKILIEECELTRKLYRFATRKPTNSQEGNVIAQGPKYTNLEKIFGFCLSLLKGYRYESAVSLELDSDLIKHERRSHSKGEPIGESANKDADLNKPKLANPSKQQSWDLTKIKLTYFPLDIGPLFSDLINKTHAVLFTGGTMKPKGLLERVLSTCLKQVVSKDFPAVVPLAHVNCTIIPSLPGADLHFVQGNSSKITNNLEAVRLMLQSIHPEIPGGIIVFFTSYQTLGKFRDLCSSKLDSHSRRRLFFDAAGSTGVFEKYSECIKESKANKGQYAYLFTVMGGRLSEGINFKDELARCVVLVGLPYPNRYASEIKLRMAYFDTTCQPKAVGQPASFSGGEYYQSQCLKVVNQTVGRAVRHSKDFASILLVDRRFSQTSVLQGMPQWVVAHKQELNTLEALGDRLRMFFLERTLG